MCQLHALLGLSHSASVDVGKQEGREGITYGLEAYLGFGCCVQANRVICDDSKS